jgi:hypothetical protein
MGVLLGRLLRASAEIQHPPGVVEPAAHRVPARRVRQEEQSDGQENRRDRSEAKHDPPDMRVVDDLVEERVHDERQELPRHDQQLVDRDHPTAHVHRHRLGQVQRNGRQGGADPQPEQDPEDHHDGHVRR